MAGHDLHEPPRPERPAVHGVAVDAGDDLPRAFLAGTHHARDPPARVVVPLVLFQGARAHGGVLGSEKGIIEGEDNRLAWGKSDRRGPATNLHSSVRIEVD